MPASSPTRRPTDADFLDRHGPELPTELLNLPWIDGHNHAHTLSWEDRERYALAGCRAMVLVASGYHWTPYKPVAPDDIRYLWDSTINRREQIERNHFFETGLGIGIHTGVRLEEPEELLAAMDAYCSLEEVVAVGETGITPSQHVSAWDLQGQRAVVREQMALANEHDLPVILHTPSDASGALRSGRPGVGLPGYEKNTSLGQSPVLTGDNPRLGAVRIDVELANEAGLAEDRVVASHADPNNLQYLLEETDCYASFTIGHSWLIGVTVADVAEAIQKYGPERIMIDTDCANVLRTDPFSLKRAIFELYHRGIEPEAIRQVVLDNPIDVYGLGG